MTFRKSFFAGAAALMIAAPVVGPALAQDTREEVIVVAPFMRQQNEMPLRGGMRTETLTANRIVKYGDLDLTQTADRDLLTHRITLAAQDACRDLYIRFPEIVYVPVSDDRNCVGEARDKAIAMVDFRDGRYAGNYGYLPE